MYKRFSKLYAFHRQLASSYSRTLASNTVVLCPAMAAMLSGPCSAGCHRNGARGHSVGEERGAGAATRVKISRTVAPFFLYQFRRRSRRQSSAKSSICRVSRSSNHSSGSGKQSAEKTYRVQAALPIISPLHEMKHAEATSCAA